MATEYTISKSGVKHDEAHSLRTNKSLAPFDKEAREWVCICGHNFGKLYDSTAVTQYRAHRKEAK